MSITRPAAHLRAQPEPSGLRVFLEGHLDVYTLAALWPQAQALLQRHPDTTIIVDGSRLEYCDSAGIGLLIDLTIQPRQDGAPVRLENLPETASRLLAQFDLNQLAQPVNPANPERSWRQRWSDSLHDVGKHLYDHILFVGHSSAALMYALRHPRSVRWNDAFAIMQEAGVKALPIVALIAFLLGVILAFQSAIAMRQFGAEIFVANLLALSLFRELGPLMTAILLAGRSASAFAAEIGTMKVNEEINALTTMGLDPVRFLVITRIMAGVIVAPLLTIFADMIGLIGGAVVMLSFDVPLTTYFNQVAAALALNDFLGGLFKAAVFGLLVAGVGCLYGLQTGTGAAAVGISTTRAVVSAIILIVIADGLFAVLFFHLGI
ncbi:ABC transporter permease [Thiorhodospira sibirica]|uniref:ABC transporter permease n=1 Tax=Thiorhodospira sibirica TaxID=154347 RepID=UPI00022C596A|nr:MlaE family lipid ABC transporter permease subunit [Thiorhodospira sibirica]